ncbi:MAG: hypothetical protein JNK40_07430 [Chromatiales bacterium]|nr:hypothetical protein [Chromatiales bacterium]
MSKATYSFVTLALLVLAGAANAAPVTVELQKHNQISSGGALSTLKWKTCTPTGALTPCLSTTNAWTLANATGSTAVWTWDATTGVLAMTGLFQTTSFVSSNANGSPVISDKVTDLVIDTTNNTTTAATYSCVEGTFLQSVGAVGCLNLSLGDDFVNSSSALYNVGGNANCVQRTIGGDDVSTGNTRGLADAAAAGPCDAVDGAFNFWFVEKDETATGGELIVRTATAINAPGANFLTFAAVPSALDDGPFNALQSVPVELDVLANDVNFTDPVTVTVTTAPTKGTTQVIGSPGNRADIRIEYTANVAATGADSFVYTVVNGVGGVTDTATVTLNILAGGANDDTASTTRNSAAININVGANDVNFTDPVTIVITSGPNQGGTATPPVGPVNAANAIVSYTPATTAPGTPTYTETFTYELTDANDLVDTGTVTVTVSNTVPVANNGGVAISTQGFDPATRSGTFNAGTFAGNSLGNTPSVVTFTQGTNGTVTGSGSVLTYTPAGTFYKGTDTFTYTITDADPGTPETATGTVTVTIADVSPTLGGGTITTTEGTASAPKALTFTAGNGSVAQHTLAVTTQATNGSCALAGTSVVYTPNAAYTGPDSCVVTITDENGAGQSATGTFTITVTAAGGGGGGAPGGLLPGGGAFDPWSLALLAGLPLLGRLRASRRRQAAGNQ